MNEIQLAEASVENIRVLKQLALAIWNSVGGVFEGETKEVYLSQLPGFTRIYQAYNDHEKFSLPFAIMETTKLRIVNDEDYQDQHYPNNTRVWGYHSAADNLLLIWMSNIARHPVEINAAARSTLVHELRHLFQHALYPEYFKSRKAFQKPYEEQQIEIDAVWSQLLAAEIDVSDYQDAHTDFVSDVMQQLMAYKKLSDREIQHYSRKTVKYFRQFFDENVEAEWQKIIQHWASLTKNPDYTVDNFVGDVMQDFTEYVKYEIQNPKIKQQILDFYSQETRKKYKQLTTGVRSEKRKKAAINQLMPEWNRIVNRYEAEWIDPKVNSLRLMNTIIQQLDPKLRALLGRSPDLFNEVRVWFVRLTKESIQNSRTWNKQPAVAGNNT